MDMEIDETNVWVIIFGGTHHAFPEIDTIWKNKSDAVAYLIKKYNDTYNTNVLFLPDLLNKDHIYIGQTVYCIKKYALY
jgi:hypothetical protein